MPSGASAKKPENMIRNFYCHIVTLVTVVLLAIGSFCAAKSPVSQIYVPRYEFLDSIPGRYEVVGVVVDDEYGDALIGVEVAVDGSGKAVRTGIDGVFRIGVNKLPTTLVCSYYRFLDQKVIIDKSNYKDTITVVLEKDKSYSDELPIPVGR